MKFIYNTIIVFLAAFYNSYRPKRQNNGPTYVGSADSLIHVPSLSSKIDQLTPSRVKPPREAGDARSNKAQTHIISGKGRQTDILSQNPNRLSQKIPGRAPDLVWTAATSNSQPTDPSIAVGPNHIIAVFNTGFAIYDKDGNTLVPQTSPNPDIFPSGGCCDLTVSYDPVATSASNPTPGRWVLTFLGAGAQIAVSDGPDPVNAGWNVYTINTINDYQKLSVWSDGYYITDQSSGTRVYALERQAMLDGEPAGNVSIQGFTLPNFNNFGFASLQALNIADDQYPGPGNATLVFFQDDAYAGQSNDSVKFWDLDVDFDTPGNSTISTPQEVIVTPFTSIFDNAAFDNLTQPGGQDIDALQGIIMNQAQYKKFPTYESAIFNFVIDIDPGGSEQAAIRWYEFRRSTPTSPWVMEQEGTFADPNGRHFWHASMIMDTQGNIGMGFSAMGNTATGNGLANEFVSSYYTGRLASDPSGTMTITPQLIASGTRNIPGAERYGDYSKIDLDPVDYKRMYFNNEIMFPNRSNVVGRFQIAPDFTLDAGIVDIVAPVDGEFSAPQDITVTVRNFGTNSISNVPIGYSIDGGTPVNEVVAGPIVGSGGSVDYTFTVQADLSVVGQTYTIESSTGLIGDENISNDSFSSDVLNIAPNVGVTTILNPSSGSGLSGNENVTIEISNFGSITQTSIPVFYSVNGATQIQEIYTGSIVSGGTDTYTFSTQVDLSALGSYNFIAGTQLNGDADESNDDATKTVNNTSCIPTGECQGFNDGVTQIQLADQDIVTNCNASGYSDDTDIVFNFSLSENPFSGVLQMGWEDSEFAIWIDFNDDGTFSANELLANDLVAVRNTDFGFTIDFNSFPNATLGSHLMRIRGEDQSGFGVVTDPCDNLQYGRTNDYTVNICTELNLKVYLAGALINNSGAVGSGGEPLMRDNLRNSIFEASTTYLPFEEPYTDLEGFSHAGSGGGEVAKTTAFDDRGQDSVVDWIFIEFRDKNDMNNILETKSALVQRDGDVVDIDGISPIKLCTTDSEYYLAIRHRNHFGVMTALPEDLKIDNTVDFSNNNAGGSGVFNYGTSHPEGGVLGFDYTGLSQQSEYAFVALPGGVSALWLGNPSGDSKIKFESPNDDLNHLLFTVLLFPGNTSIQPVYDFAFGYSRGDVNMDGKVKYTAPGDDTTIIFNQVLIYPLNISFLIAFDFIFEQLPQR